jgi:hypothetical protein
MVKITRLMAFGLLSLAVVFLAACNVALPAGAEAKISADGKSVQVEFNGVVDSIQTTISGVVVLITPQTKLDSGLVIGSNVKAVVVTNPDGSITALKIQTFNNSESDEDSSNHNNGSGEDDKGSNGPGDENGGGDD